MKKSERIYNELLREQTAIWYISDEVGSKIMVKAPTTSLKALTKGCRMELLFGRDESLNPNVFHTGLKIYDDAINFQMIFCVHRFLDEHLSTAKIFNLDKVQIQFFNELNACTAYGDIIISDESRHKVLALLGNPKKLYSGEFTYEIIESLDRFQDCFWSQASICPQSLHIAEVAAQVNMFNTVRNIIYYDDVEIDMHIMGNEGQEFEKEVFAVLYSLFENDTFINPRISSKTGYRELTDILAFSDVGIFIVETKALGIINADSGRTMKRKVAGLQKQIIKAIDQLVGAMRKIADKTPIYDTNGNEIVINRNLVPHGIVLVSELFPFGKWNEVLVAILKGMRESKGMIHVMDMKEYMQFIGHAAGDKYKFDDFLCQRANNFVRNPDLFQGSTFIDTLPGDDAE